MKKTDLARNAHVPSEKQSIQPIKRGYIKTCSFFLYGLFYRKTGDASSLINAATFLKIIIEFNLTLLSVISSKSYIKNDLSQNGFIKRF